MNRIGECHTDILVLNSPIHCEMNLVDENRLLTLGLRHKKAILLAFV